MEYFVFLDTEELGKQGAKLVNAVNFAVLSM